ncbi:hypothetical protein VIGAN_05147500, partial [Vigna angularis var. angularis]
EFQRPKDPEREETIQRERKRVEITQQFLILFQLSTLETVDFAWQFFIPRRTRFSPFVRPIRRVNKTLLSS